MKKNIFKMAGSCNYNIDNVHEKPSCGDLRKRNEFQIAPHHLDPENQNVTNLLVSNSQTSATNPPLLYQNSSFTGFYSSPGINNSLSGYENNMQWLTENRIPNQHNQLACGVITDKNSNNSAHTLANTSHSCCVNRFSVLDSLGMASPDQGKASCDIAGYQNKTMNMIDPLQSWLNFQMPPQISNNQQYCKYNERPLGSQNFNIPVSLASQINIPMLEQQDVRQNDMTLQGQDQCFQNVNNINTIKQAGKQVTNSKPQIFPPENKQMMVSNTDGTHKQHNSYQAGLQSKEWKSTFQNMSSYIQSPSVPNVFGSVNENQENFIFPQFSMPPAKLYYPPVDNYQLIGKCSNSNLSCINQTNVDDGNNVNQPLTSINNSDSHVSKLSSTGAQINLKSGSLYISKPSAQIDSDRPAYKNGETVTFNSASHLENSLNDCRKTAICKDVSEGVDEIKQFSSSRPKLCQDNQSNNPIYRNKPMSLENIDNTQISNKSSFRISESSESDESNIIVEESDDIGEMESEISIEEIKKSYQDTEPSISEVQLRCVICNSATPANQFIHLNNSFPLISISKTPVRSKLEEILPMDIHHYLKLHNSFMCRRCLNLVETVEVLEIKLKTTKQTIRDSFIKTFRQVAPDLDPTLKGLKIKTAASQKNKCDSSLPKENKTCKELNETDHYFENDDNKECAEDVEDLKTNQLECNFCFKMLSSQKNLNLHMQQHTNEFSFYCEKCGKGFPLKAGLERHLFLHSSFGKECPILCDKCGETFNTKDLFNSHNTKMHSQEFRFKCETCGKGFTRKVSLEIHTHKHTGERPYVCEYCGFTFHSESALRNHIKICRKDLPHRCEECGKSFPSSAQLSRHKYQHGGSKQHSCPKCDKQFSKPCDLSRHILSHSTVKMFKCTNCGKSFKTMGNLNHHSKFVHKKELMFKCRICAKLLTSKSLLNDHEKCHEGEKPYKCEKCDKSFTYQSNYIAHLRVHEDKVKPKTCQECGKSVKTRMSIHMRTHNGEKPYLCSYCPQAFSVSQSLWKHIQRKHPPN